MAGSRRGSGARNRRSTATRNTNVSTVWIVVQTAFHCGGRLAGPKPSASAHQHSMIASAERDSRQASGAISVASHRTGKKA